MGPLWRAWLDCRPDILNPDPIWRPQHLKPQETFFFFNNFLREFTRATREMLQMEKHTRWINLHTRKKKPSHPPTRLQSNYSHNDENCTHPFMITVIWTEGNWGYIEQLEIQAELLLPPDIINFDGSCCDSGCRQEQQRNVVFSVTYHSSLFTRLYDYFISAHIVSDCHHLKTNVKCYLYLTHYMA